MARVACRGGRARGRMIAGDVDGVGFESLLASLFTLYYFLLTTPYMLYEKNPNETVRASFRVQLTKLMI